MQSTLTVSSIIALFGIMVIGALIPGVSVLAVSARSATSGFIHGVFTTLGIIVGDIIFIVFALFGLSVLAEMMGSLFIAIKILGAAYLIWFGIVLLRSRSTVAEVGGATGTSLQSSFLAGLLITLGDQKAILFYFGFFPAFLDLSKITYLDAGIIIALAIVAIGCVKLCYAYMAANASRLFRNPVATKRINMLAGTIMIGLGIFLAVVQGQAFNIKF